jgi:hypothetical protein
MAVTTFFLRPLGAFFVEEQLGDQQLEALDLVFQFTDAAGVLDDSGVVALPPAVIGVLADAEFAAPVGDRQALGQVAVGFAQQAHDLVGGPSLAPESLLDLFYPD